MRLNVPRRRRAHIGVAALLAMGAASPAAAECSLNVFADLPVTIRERRAHVPVKVNGRETDFWIDSGAFFSMMSEARAVELQLTPKPLPSDFRVIGIGGSVNVRLATIRSFGLIGQQVKDVQFLVGGSDVGNAFIGNNILAIADTEFDLANGSVKLVKPQGCDKDALAYWAGDKPFFTVELNKDFASLSDAFRLPVSINGTTIQATFDTGAPSSVLSRSAAERAGIDLSGAGVTRLDGMSGIGRRKAGGWQVPVDKVTIGEEQILRTRLEVIDADIGDGDVDMLVGLDFMLAHHIYVARGQKMIYFTYAGGRVFQTSASEAAPAAPSALPDGTRRAEAVRGDPAEPKTADAFARRAGARLAQRQFATAIADLSAAIALSPQTGHHYRDRAEAYRQSGQEAPALADLDKAIALAPGNGDYRVTRARSRLQNKDRAGALADVEAAHKLVAPSSLTMAEIAALFARLGQRARAVALYEGVIATHRQDSGLGSLLNGRCWMRATANIELDKALADCNQAIRRDGARADYLDSRGLVYYRMKDYRAAIADYDAALKLAPDLALSLYFRGMAKLALGDIAAGNADKAAAVAINSTIATDIAESGFAP